MEFVAAALTFGLSAGLTPGPFMAVVVAEALTGGWRRGALAALAPFLTDGAMILASLWALGSLPPAAGAAVEGVGGLVLLWFGYGTLRARPPAPAAEAAAAAEGGSPGGALAPLWRGAAVNALNPAAWVFWLTAGGPLLQRAAAAGPGHVAAFLGLFFGLLVGIKVLMAAAAAAGRGWLGGRAYRTVMLGIGTALFLMGARALYAASRYFLGA